MITVEKVKIRGMNVLCLIEMFSDNSTVPDYCLYLGAYVNKQLYQQSNYYNEDIPLY